MFGELVCPAISTEISGASPGLKPAEGPSGIRQKIDKHTNRKDKTDKKQRSEIKKKDYQINMTELKQSGDSGQKSDKTGGVFLLT